MLLHKKPVCSTNEFATSSEALVSGFRPDGRAFDAPRRLIVETSSRPFATVRLGRTSVTALSTAKIMIPSEASPSRGRHTIKLFAPTADRSAIAEFEMYFQMLWEKVHVVEEESLCMKPGEKAWSVTTTVVVNDDDGGLVDAIFTACYVSLSGLSFPCFDTMTGALYPPSQRRPHRIAFTVRPTAVTVGFLDGRRVIDPTLVEMQKLARFATFVFDEHGEQLLLDGILLGDVEASRREALEVAKEWRRVVADAVVGPIGLQCAGSPADFIGYEPKKFEVPALSKWRELEAFQVWIGSVDESFVIDLFAGVEEATEAGCASQESAGVNWLQASLA